MNPKLQGQVNKLEAGRKKLLNSLKQYPDDLLNKKPASGAWSAVQVMLHLMESESASLKYLQKKTLDTSRSKNAGFKGKGKLLLTQIMFYVPVKFQAPGIMIPGDAFTSLAEIATQWDKIRSDLIQLIGKLPDADLKKELWKHAVAGKMNIYQMLDFFQIHFERHERQIGRTIRQQQSI